MTVNPKISETRLSQTPIQNLFIFIFFLPMRSTPIKRNANQQTVASPYSNQMAKFTHTIMAGSITAS
jgi:hypothetical protein